MRWGAEECGVGSEGGGLRVVGVGVGERRGYWGWGGVRWGLRVVGVEGEVGGLRYWGWGVVGAESVGVRVRG